MRDHGDEDDGVGKICGICCDELAKPCDHEAEIARLRAQCGDRQAITKEDAAEIARLREDWEEASDAWARALTDNASLRKERDRLRKGWARAVVKQWQAGAWKGHRRVVLASRLSEVYDREVSVEEAREVEREC